LVLGGREEGAKCANFHLGDLRLQLHDFVPVFLLRLGQLLHSILPKKKITKDLRESHSLIIVVGWYLVMVLTLLVLVLVLFHAAVWIAHLVHLRKHRALSKLKRGYTLQSLSLSLSLSTK
jgi:hypothetical protein